MSLAAEPTVIAHTEIGAPMGQAFAVDEARGVAWLGDWGWLRRVDLVSGAVDSTSLGEFPAVREVVVDSSGAVSLLADHDVDQPSTDGFRAPAADEVRFVVLRLVGAALEPRVDLRLQRGQVERVVLSLCAASDGTWLVPHADGIAHVRADDTVIARYPGGRLKYYGARAAISPNGRWIAVASRSGEITIYDPTGGPSERRTLEMDDVLSLAVRDDSTLDVGIGTPDFNFHRLPPSGPPLRIEARSARYAATPDAIYSSSDSTLTIWDAKGEQPATRPIIDGDRGSRIVVTDRALYLRTSSGVFQRYLVT
jgi:hypothetical protein